MFGVVSFCFVRRVSQTPVSCSGQPIALPALILHAGPTTVRCLSRVAAVVRHGKRITCSTTTRPYMLSPTTYSPAPLGLAQPPIPLRRASILSVARPHHLSLSIRCATPPPTPYDQAPEPRIRLWLVYTYREFRWVAESQCFLRLVVRALARIRNLPCCVLATKEASEHANEAPRAA